VKEVLVTGGCGFIGSQLVRALKALNCNVTVIDRKKSNIEHGVSYWFKDLQNYNEILNIFNNKDVVFHLAADVSINYCNNNPKETLLNNTVSTLNVLECCKDAGVKRVVFSSTAAVYREKNYNKSYKEKDKIKPSNPYSVSKIYGENLCKIYSNLYGLETVILRYFNVYGRVDIVSNYSSVLNNFLYAIKNNLPIKVTGDGNQARDFIHVEDICSANIAAATIELKKYGKAFNIGTGKSITINDIANKLSKNIEFIDKVPGELYSSKASIKRAKSILKWEPRHKVLDWLDQKTK
jgi:UDP-glucose 4-epimerase